MKPKLAEMIVYFRSLATRDGFSEARLAAAVGYSEALNAVSSIHKNTDIDEKTRSEYLLKTSQCLEPLKLSPALSMFTLQMIEAIGSWPRSSLGFREEPSSNVI